MILFVFGCDRRENDEDSVQVLHRRYSGDTAASKSLAVTWAGDGRLPVCSDGASKDERLTLIFASQELALLSKRSFSTPTSQHSSKASPAPTSAFQVNGADHEWDEHARDGSMK